MCERDSTVGSLHNNIQQTVFGIATFFDASIEMVKRSF